MRPSRLLLVAMCVCWSVPRADAAPVSVHDVAADFSRTNNPNGVWSYGWSFGLGSPVIESTDPRVREGLDTWRGNRAADGNPAIYENTTGSPILLGGTALYQPGQFGLHPGPAGEFAVARWTAPASGTITIDSAFVGQDVFNTTTDAHILHNGSVPLFASLVEGFGDTSEVYSRIIMTVLAGDTVDFSVGFGRNGNFSNDSTGLSATITPEPVPEPATWLLFASGLAVVLRHHRQRRQRTN